MATVGEFFSAVRQERQSNTLLFAGRTAARGLLMAVFERPDQSFDRHYVLAARQDASSGSSLVVHEAHFVRRADQNEIDIIDAVPQTALASLGSYKYNAAVNALFTNEIAARFALHPQGLPNASALVEHFQPDVSRLQVTTLPSGQIMARLGFARLPDIMPIDVESFSEADLALSSPATEPTAA